MNALKLKSPLVTEITLTEECNHKCIHCYNHWRKDEKAIKSLSKEYIDKISLILKENEVFNVTISWWEPLYVFNDLIYMINSIKNSGLTMTMNSNITLLDENKAKKLKEAWLDVILTSLPSWSPEICDSITQIKWSFYKILQWIQIAQNNWIEVWINTVVYENNIDDLNETWKIVWKLWVPYFAASLWIPPNYDKNNSEYKFTQNSIKKLADALLEIKSKYWTYVDTVTPLPLCFLEDVNKYQDVIRKACAWWITHMTIWVKGETYACSHEKITYWNILEDGLKKCWDWMSEWRNDNLLNEDCKGCDYIWLCWWECKILTQTSNKWSYKEYIKNIRNFESMSVNNNNLETTLEGLFKVNDNIRYRLEDFWWVVNLWYTRNVFLDSTWIDILKILIDKKEEFDISFLEKFVNIDDNFKILFNYFIKKNIVTRL